MKKKHKKKSPFIAIVAAPDPAKSLEECNKELKRLIKSSNKIAKEFICSTVKELFPIKHIPIELEF